MSFPPAYRDSPRNNTSYTGQTYSFAPIFYRKRDPTALDLRPKEAQGYYPYGSLWFNTTGLNIWYLMKISSVGGKPNAFWVQLVEGANTGPLLTLTDTSGTVVHPTLDSAIPPGNIQLVGGTGITVVSTPGSNLLTITNTGSGTETLTGDDGVIVSPSAGTIQTLGNTVANATHSKALFTTNSAGNIERFDIQVAAAIAAGDATKSGIAAFNNTQFTVNTTTGFVSLLGGTGASILGVTPDAHTGPGTTPVVPNGSGNIILEGGATFATATQANPIRTNSLAANTIDLQIQLAGSNAAVSTANNFGVCQFDSNSFNVVGGFVKLAASGTDIQTLTGNSGGAISPAAGNINTLGTGSITIAGAGSTLTTQLTGLTNHAIQVGAGTATLTQLTLGSTGQVLQSGGAGGDPTWSTPTYPSTSGSAGVILRSDGTNNVYTTATYPATTTINQLLYSSSNNVIAGLATANRAVITTTAAGVPVATALATDGQLIIGSTAGAPAAATLTAGTGITITNASNSITIASTNGAPTVGLTPDTHTGPGTTPVVPNGSGNIILSGGVTFNTGTQANPIRTNSLAVNTLTIETQLAGSNAAVSTPNNFGVCQFNSNQFTVSAGYVTSNNFTINTGAGLSGGGSITLGGTLTLTASAISFTWTDQSVSFAAAINNGYFCTAALTATLPLTATQSNEVQFVVTSAGALTIQAAAGQKIRLGNTISAAAGTAVNTAIGATISLVFRTSDLTWYAIASTGTWTIT